MNDKSFATAVEDNQNKPQISILTIPMTYSIDQLYSFAAEVERILSSSAGDEAVALLKPHLSNEVLSKFNSTDNDADSILNKLKELCTSFSDTITNEQRKHIAKELKVLLAKRSVRISIDRVLSKPTSSSEPTPFPVNIPAEITSSIPNLNDTQWAALSAEANTELEKDARMCRIREVLQDYGSDSVRRDLARKIVAALEDIGSSELPDQRPEGLEIDAGIWESLKKTIIADTRRKLEIQRFANQLSRYGTNAEARDWAKKLIDLLEESSRCDSAVLIKPILDSLTHLQSIFVDGFPGNEQEELKRTIAENVAKLKNISDTVGSQNQTSAPVEFAEAVSQIGELVDKIDAFLESDRLSLEIQLEVLERKRGKPSLISLGEFKSQLKEFRSRIETDVDELLERLKVEQKKHLETCQTKLQIAIEAKAIEAGHLLITPSTDHDTGIPVGQVAYTFQQEVTNDSGLDGVLKAHQYEDKAKFASFAQSLNEVIASESQRLSTLCADQVRTQPQDQIMPEQADTSGATIDFSAFFNPAATIKSHTDNLSKIKKLIPVDAAVENFTRVNSGTFLELLKSAAAMPARTLGLLFVVFAPFVLLGFGNFGKDLTKSFGQATQLDPLVGISTMLFVLAFFVTTALVKLRVFNRTVNCEKRVYGGPFFIPWGIAALFTFIGFAILSLLFQWSVATPLSYYCADYSDDWYAKADVLKNRIESDLKQKKRNVESTSNTEAQTPFDKLGEKTFFFAGAQGENDFEEDAFIVNKNAVLLYDNYSSSKNAENPIKTAVGEMITTYDSTNGLEVRVELSRKRYLELEGSDYWQRIKNNPKINDSDSTNKKWQWLIDGRKKLEESDSYLFVLRFLKEFLQEELRGNKDPNVEEFGKFLSGTQGLSKEDIQQKYREVWIKDELVPAYRDALRRSFLRPTDDRKRVSSLTNVAKNSQPDIEGSATQSGSPSADVTSSIVDAGMVEFDKTIDAYGRFVAIKGWARQSDVSIVVWMLIYVMGVLGLLFGLAMGTPKCDRRFNSGVSLAAVASLLLVAALGLSVWSTVSKLSDDAANSYAELLADKSATLIHVPSRTLSDSLTFNLSADYAPQVPDPNELLPLEKRVGVVAQSQLATNGNQSAEAQGGPAEAAAQPQPILAKPVSISDFAPAFTVWLSLALGLVLVGCYGVSWRAYQRSLDFKKTEANQFFKAALLAAVQKGISEHIASQEREVRETLHSLIDIRIRTHEFELEKRFERACNSAKQSHETLSNQIMILKKRLEVPRQVAIKLDALKKTIEKAV